MSEIGNILESNKNTTPKGPVSILYFSGLDDEVQQIRSQLESDNTNNKIVKAAYSLLSDSWREAYTEISDENGEFRDYNTDLQSLHEYALMEKEIAELDQEYALQNRSLTEAIAEYSEDQEFVEYVEKEF